MNKIMSKIKGAWRVHRKTLMTCVMVVAVMAMSIIPSFATDGSAVVTTSDFTSVLTALQNQISVATVVQVLVVLVGATVGLAFMWWGVRKLTSALMKAFKKGRVSL